MLCHYPAFPDTTAYEVPLRLFMMLFFHFSLSRKQSKSYLVGVSV